MDEINKTRQTDGWMKSQIVGSKITRQMGGRIESQMVGSKINRNNGWSDRKLSGQFENNSLNRWTDEELNGRLENNSPNGWSNEELNGQLENSSQNGWTDRARVQHGLSLSGNLINMYKIGKIASVGFNSQLLANTLRNWNSEYQKCKIQPKF